jgi:hypothetical protein
MATSNTIVVDDYLDDNSVRVCLLGRRVSSQFKFRKIGSSSSITIEVPHLSKSIGLILSAVVSSSYEMKERNNDAIIKCQSNSKYSRRQYGVFSFSKPVILI